MVIKRETNFQFVVKHMLGAESMRLRAEKRDCAGGAHLAGAV